MEVVVDLWDHTLWADGEVRADGKVLMVAAVGVSGTRCVGAPWLRCTDGTSYTMPICFHDWVISVIAAETERQQRGTTMFPMTVRLTATTAVASSLSPIPNN
ncbi:hypothetical protein [Nocardia kruczakiae]|uniref:hypothetical protein n=1 Tax=Nocardia kruczakiae TaxID=261477 RepID=UPI0007A55C12|nr:hypothetical protein [Nocardia kruczakiae]